MIAANIQEVFYSLQGEGKYAGLPMIFVRFTGCNLNCRYCDTRRAFSPQRYCLYEPQPFSGKLLQIPNDVSVTDCRKLIAAIQLPARYVAFTGGEPLLQAEYIAALITSLGNRHKYFLETNGTLPDKLGPLLSKIDVFSVDLKPGRERQFLEFCRRLEKSGKPGKDIYIKLVLENKMDLEKIIPALKKVNKEIYLQPEYGKKLNKILLLELIKKFNQNRLKFRLIPQLHKYIKIS